MSYPRRLPHRLCSHTARGMPFSICLLHHWPVLGIEQAVIPEVNDPNKLVGRHVLPGTAHRKFTGTCAPSCGNVMTTEGTTPGVGSDEGSLASTRPAGGASDCEDSETVGVGEELFGPAVGGITDEPSQIITTPAAITTRGAGTPVMSMSPVFMFPDWIAAEVPLVNKTIPTTMTTRRAQQGQYPYPHPINPGK
jgi:hypothetical protein